MKKPKLTVKQQDLYNWVFNTKSPDGFYCETGVYKPFDIRTVRSLYNKKLIEIIDSGYDNKDPNYSRNGDWFILKPNKAQFREDRLKKILGC